MAKNHALIVAEALRDRGVRFRRDPNSVKRLSHNGDVFSFLAHSFQERGETKTATVVTWEMKDGSTGAEIILAKPVGEISKAIRNDRLTLEQKPLAGCANALVLDVSA